MPDSVCWKFQFFAQNETNQTERLAQWYERTRRVLYANNHIERKPFVWKCYYIFPNTAGTYHLLAVSPLLIMCLILVPVLSQSRFIESRAAAGDFLFASAAPSRAVLTVHCWAQACWLPQHPMEYSGWFGNWGRHKQAEHHRSNLENKAVDWRKFFKLHLQSEIGESIHFLISSFISLKLNKITHTLKCKYCNFQVKNWCNYQ